MHTDAPGHNSARIIPETNFGQCDGHVSADQNIVRKYDVPGQTRMLGLDSKPLKRRHF